MASRRHALQPSYCVSLSCAAASRHQHLAATLSPRQTCAAVCVCVSVAHCTPRQSSTSDRGRAAVQPLQYHDLDIEHERF